MDDERTQEASRDIGKDLELSPPQPQQKTSSWWVPQFNRVELAPLPDPCLVSASTQQADYLVDAPTKHMLSANTSLDPLSSGADCTRTDNLKRKEKCEYPSPHEDSDGICMEKKEESPSGKKLKIFRETHNLSERNRRAKISQQFQKLQKLIPPGNTASQASILDRTVTYIKSVKGLLQMLSTMSPENAEAIQQFYSSKFG
ncbi:hypothetical protein DCAR_0100312 [Daucus carota subsp. sativus]|nr:PREDICTED: transcription factor PIF1-like [Daucus carota subsp. sativus]WOG81167.1 hypothetical protein DCAR_0100312 [Daucus carota subsp. sativus]